MIKPPLVVTISRLGFLIYGLFIVFAMFSRLFAESEASIGWFAYLAVIYLVAEQLYATFRARGVDLAFAFPIMLAIYILSLASLFFQAQERLPIINRAEHFCVFVLLTYVIWVFFLKYLPHNVWSDHPYYTAILAFSLAASFGVINEIVELFVDSVYGTHLIGASRFDTPLDLLMNTLGSVTFLSAELILGLTDRQTNQDHQ